MQDKKLYSPPLLTVELFPETDIVRTSDSDFLEWDKERQAFTKGWSDNEDLFY